MNNIKNEDAFNNFIHVIFYLTAVKIYDENNDQHRQITKYYIILRFFEHHALTLTNNDNDILLFKNQINVHISGMAKNIHHYRSRVC